MIIIGFIAFHKRFLLKVDLNGENVVKRKKNNMILKI